MMNFLAKLIFYFRKPKIILVTGKGASMAAEAIFRVLKIKFKVVKAEEIGPRIISQNEILILESQIKSVGDFKFFLEKSKLPILVITHIGEIPPDKDFFTGEKEDAERILKLAKILLPQNNLILNFDDKTVGEIKDLTNLKTLTFGFQEGADFRATDIKVNSDTNFKINHKGKTVPIWLEKLFGTEQIYAALAAVAVGTIFDLNLVEISQAFKNYKA